MPGEPTPESLIVRKGQEITADHHNRLVRFADRLTLQRGALKGRQDSDGFTPRITVSTTLSVSHAFKVAVTAGQNPDEQLATFTLGHVAGIIPTIDDRALDDLDENGDPPALIVKADAWKKHGRGERALLMFRYELTHDDFTVAKVVPVAVPEPPAAAPYTWHKLIAILQRTDDEIRATQICFFSQEFDTSERTATGRFHAWPRIA